MEAGGDYDWEAPNRCRFVDSENRQCIYQGEIQGWCTCHFFNVDEKSFAPGIVVRKKAKTTTRAHHRIPVKAKRHRVRCWRDKSQTTLDAFFVKT